MTASKINITVLVAPLDWGLGHCTRCIPLVHYFQQKGCTVVLAAEGAQARLLQLEFPALKILPLRGYRIQYSTGRRWFTFKILLQLPKIIMAIQKEQKWLKALVQKEDIDLIISDNRYGLHHHSVPSILITHQLQVQTPFAWAERLVQKGLYKFINRFSACWVPDGKNENSLAGKLSHPASKPAIPVQYIGPLSRMNKENEQPLKEYDVLVLLSGPEPQRTLMEQIIVSQVKDIKANILLVRGLPLAEETLKIDGVMIKNHLPSTELQLAIKQAEVVISRSGYSTVMDLCKLEKRSILIPTPGQTEQEYLGKYLMNKGWCLYYDQENFNLRKAIESANTVSNRFPALPMDGYKTAIDELLADHLKQKAG